MLEDAARRSEPDSHFGTMMITDSVRSTGGASGLLEFPPEILLHIRAFFCRVHELAVWGLILVLYLYTVSYLDLPDLALLAQVAPALVPLTTDSVLHSYRLRVVSPSRVDHYLFGKSPQGHALRPTVPDLVRRGVLCGLDLERRWRVGAYFYSLSVCFLFLFVQEL